MTSSTTCSEDAESKLSCSSFEVCTFPSLSSCFSTLPLSCFEPTAGSTKKQPNQVLYSTEYTAETAVYSSNLFTHCKQMCTEAAAERFSKVGRGGVNKKGALSGKSGTYKWKYQSDNLQCLEIGIYPYIVTTLSGMTPIFVSLSTVYMVQVTA